MRPPPASSRSTPHLSTPHLTALRLTALRLIALIRFGQQAIVEGKMFGTLWPAPDEMAVRAAQVKPRPRVRRSRTARAKIPASARSAD